MRIKKYIEYIKERFGEYRPSPYVTPNKTSPKITDFSQSTPNGLGGSRNPNSETIPPDDQFEVGYKRFLRDFKNSKIINKPRKNTHWKKRRKSKKRNTLLNELFEPKNISYKILDKDVIHQSDMLKVIFTIEVDDLSYKFFFLYESYYLTVDFKVNRDEYGEYDGYGEKTNKFNMVKILHIVSDLLEEYKDIANKTYEKFLIKELVASPAKEDNEDYIEAENTKRGRIYKYWLDSKIDKYRKKYSIDFFSTEREFVYEFEPMIPLQKLTLK